MNKKQASWDDIFYRISLSKIPFPSKLSEEYYGKIKKYLPKKAKLLEAGSGTGEISAYFAKNGNEVYLLDKSKVALDLSKRIFSKYKLKGTFVKADLFSIPFSDNTFDCVWNSGVLEHFSDEEIVCALKEMSRVSKNLVISLVPSAQSVIYRMVKWELEAQNKWQYGDEFPKYTLQPQFRTAGLNVLDEIFIGSYSGLLWIKEIIKLPLQLLNNLASWSEGVEEERLKDGLAYLLLTIGTKRDDVKSYASKNNSEYTIRQKDNRILILNKKLKQTQKELEDIQHSRFWLAYRLFKKLKKYNIKK